MRRLLIGCCIALFASNSIAAFGQNDPVNTELVGQWDGSDDNYGDVWGDGDYAYIGNWGGSVIHIIDISDPANPGPAVPYQLPEGAMGSAQDLKVAEGLLFIGIEGGSSVGVHIVDVRDPTSPVGLVNIDIAGFNAIHNTFYYQGFLYIVDSGSPRIGIVDLTKFDPDNPPGHPISELTWMLDGVGSSFVHDITVENGRLYASAWDSGVWIYDVTEVATQLPSFLGQTPDGGDNTHSCWPSDNGDYVVTGEERSGGGIKVYRITDNGESLDLELTDTFEVPEEQTFSVHNQTIVGYRLYNAWYGAGLMVFDIDPDTGLLDFVASYDTTKGSSAGAWGIYPFLGSDRVLVSDMNTGLYIFDVDPADPVDGDLNGDGMVGPLDLAMLLASWGPCLGCPADLNGDGMVGPADLAILLANWG